MSGRTARSALLALGEWLAAGGIAVSGVVCLVLLGLPRVVVGEGLGQAARAHAVCWALYCLCILARAQVRRDWE